MGDLISRMDAVQATRAGPSDEWSRDFKTGYEWAATEIMMNVLKIKPDPASARITALEAQVAAADRLADEADAAAGTLDCLGMHRPILELKIAAFRAAKGE